MTNGRVLEYQMYSSLCGKEMLWGNYALVSIKKNMVKNIVVLQAALQNCV